jgi:hypothetical protein
MRKYQQIYRYGTILIISLLLALPLGVFMLKFSTSTTSESMDKRYNFAYHDLPFFLWEENMETEKTSILTELQELGLDPQELLTLEDNPSQEPIQLPFSGFIPNCGQIRDDISYHFVQHDCGVYFKESSVIFRYNEQHSFTVQFLGSADVQPIGAGQTTHKVNYFLSDFHHTNIPTYAEIWYYDLYPAIDLRYYMSSEGLKYEFIVHPQGDPSQIIIQLNGPLNLVVTPERIIAKEMLSKVIVYEDCNLIVVQADQTKVKAQFAHQEQLKNCYHILVGFYDKNQDLIIDPVIPTYSTFLGGSGGDEGYDIAVDSVGNAYITGWTSSTDFSIQNAYQSTFQEGIEDVFITKLNATGNGIVYSTYLGGSVYDYGYAIAVDSTGNAYLTGSTLSPDFPTQNPYQTYQESSDVFVIKLNATGNGLVYSTFLGGSAYDYGEEIAVDSTGNAYITGFSESSNFPTQNSYQTYQGDGDVFITKLNATGNGLVYSTFLGGSAYDSGKGIVVDSAGNVYVTGSTMSINFPTQNPYQSVKQGGTYDGFITKLNATGNGLVYSTYFGGSLDDNSIGIAVDSAGNVYVTGRTSSSYYFPIQNAYQSTYQGNGDVFITKLNATGNSLVYSTYLGGNSYDFGEGIAVDFAGNAYIMGYTDSSNFHTQTPYQTDQGSGDAFMTEINATGNGLVYSTYLGGSDDEYGYAIAMDSEGNVYVTGYTKSSDFPTQNPYQTSYQGNIDAFVTKFPLDITPPYLSIVSPTSSVYTKNIIIVSFSGDATHYWYYIDGIDSSNQSWTEYVDRTLANGVYTLHVYGNDSAGNIAHETVNFTINCITETTSTSQTYLNVSSGFELLTLGLSLGCVVIIRYSKRLS